MEGKVPWFWRELRLAMELNCITIDLVRWIFVDRGLARLGIEEVDASCNFSLLNLLKAGEPLSISSELLSAVSVFFSRLFLF
jgi:hypothetical protein